MGGCPTRLEMVEVEVEAEGEAEAELKAMGLILFLSPKSEQDFTNRSETV
ncbi:hypothetical protein PZA11_006454 [Diplocarpon coronariae]